MKPIKYLSVEISKVTVLWVHQSRSPFTHTPPHRFAAPLENRR